MQRLSITKGHAFILGMMERHTSLDIIKRFSRFLRSLFGVLEAEFRRNKTNMGANQRDQSREPQRDSCDAWYETHKIHSEEHQRLMTLF